jgi:hypothetical protein
MLKKGSLQGVPRFWAAAGELEREAHHNTIPTFSAGANPDVLCSEGCFIKHWIGS